MRPEPDALVRDDFLPFGEELNPQHEPPDKRLHTGQERDFETGQDYLGGAAVAGGQRGTVWNSYMVPIHRSPFQRIGAPPM